MTDKDVWDRTITLIFFEAAHGSERFRQYVYPSLPYEYSINLDVVDTIREYIDKGYSAKRIFEIVEDKAYSSKLGRI